MDKTRPYLNEDLIDRKELNALMKDSEHFLSALGKKVAYDVNGAYTPE